MTTCGQSQWPIQSIRSTVTSWPVNKKCVCVSLWIKGSMADSAAVQCHTSSPSGMFLSAGMGFGASLAEPPLPLACQPVLGTAHHRCTLGEQTLPVDHIRPLVSICLTVWLLTGSLSCQLASSLPAATVGPVQYSPYESVCVFVMVAKCCSGDTYCGGTYCRGGFLGVFLL